MKNLLLFIFCLFLYTSANAQTTIVSGTSSPITITPNTNHPSLPSDVTTGTTHVWTVPSGITSITLEAWGASGGGSITSAATLGGGRGAKVKATFPVTSGKKLYFHIGRKGDTGAAGTNGGGGGGGTWITYGNYELKNLILVAGGGGGGGNGIGGNGNGMSATASLENNSNNKAGGNGGAISGGSGGGGGAENNGNGGGIAGFGGHYFGGSGGKSLLGSGAISGGFGGGGAEETGDGGGGGGFRGGNGGNENTGDGGQAGTSWVNLSTNINNTEFTSIQATSASIIAGTSGGVIGDGKLIITFTSPSVISPCFPPNLPAGITACWLGITNSDWQTASNWSTGVVPSINDKVYVPASTPHNLVIDEEVICSKVLQQHGAILKIKYNAGGILKVKF